MEILCPLLMTVVDLKSESFFNEDFFRQLVIGFIGFIILGLGYYIDHFLKRRKLKKLFVFLVEEINQNKVFLKRFKKDILDARSFVMKSTLNVFNSQYLIFRSTCDLFKKDIFILLMQQELFFYIEFDLMCLISKMYTRTDDLGKIINVFHQIHNLNDGEENGVSRDAIFLSQKESFSRLMDALDFILNEIDTFNDQVLEKISTY